MYQSLALFQTASDMARHAGTRQAAVARNIANADTPGYAARHVAKFSDSYNAARGPNMRATRPKHLQIPTTQTGTPFTSTGGEPSPNGNSVSIAEEMMHSVEVSREHNRALTIYRHAMTVMRTTLGR